MKLRSIAFFCLCAATVALFYGSLRSVLSLALHDDAYSYILLTPFVCAFFVFLSRKNIFSQIRYSPVPGSLIAAAGVVLRFVPALPGCAFLANGPASWMTASLLLFFIGGCMALFGTRALKNAAFPIGYMVVFGIPLPDPVLNVIVAALQYGTATVADAILYVARASYLRDGLAFYFPSISIVIAPECSGIRSSMVLIVLGVIAGHIFLKTIPGKTALIIMSLPLALVKNGIRVATLALLGERVDPRFITHSSLHHSGGWVFFSIAMVLLFACMFFIERVERARNAGRTPRNPEAGRSAAGTAG